MSNKKTLAASISALLVAGFISTVPVASSATSVVVSEQTASSSKALSPAEFVPVGANVGIVQVGATSVVVSWSLPAEANITRIDMAHYNYSNQQWTSLPTTTNKSGELTITGLTPSTGYAYRTHTFYASGASRLGDIQFMTSASSSPTPSPTPTPTSSPSPTPTSSPTPSPTQAPFEPVGATVAVVETTATTAVVSWTLPDQASIIRVELSHYNYSTQQWTTLPTSTSKSGRLTITGLTPATGYAFRTNTRYASGASRLGDIQFRTMNAPRQDLQLPVLVPGSVSVSNSSVLAGGQITGQFRVTDDVACCSWVRIDMRTATPFDQRDSARIWTMITPSQVSGTATDAAFSGSVTVPSATPAGRYMLYGQAIDNFGRYTHLVVLGEFEVRVAAVNTAPTLQVSDVKSRTASASWSVPNETPTRLMDLQIQEVAVGRWTSVPLSSSNSKSGQIELTLKPGTDYRVRVVATYTDGSTKSEVTSFSTPALVQPPRPTFSIDNSNPEVAVIIWNYSFSNLSKFIISIREAGASDTPLELSASARSHRFSGLKANTQFIVTLEAVANNGAAASTNVAFFTPVRRNIDPAKPVITGVSDGQSSVELSFSQETLQGADVVQRWDVQIRQSGDSSWNTVERISNDGASSRTVTINDLTPGRTYQARVVARAETGTSSVSSPREFQTTVGISAPDSLSTRDITWNSAVFTWSQAIDGAGTVPARYEVELSEEGTENWRTARSFTSSDRRPTVSISGLKAGTGYQWRVLAVSRSGAEEMSYVDYFSTPASMRSPSSLSVSDVGDTWARVTWSYVANQAFKPVASFEIRVSENQGGTWTTLVSNIARSARAVTLQDLSPETDYDVRIVAVSADGEEAYDVVTIVTNQNLEEITEVTVSLISPRSATIKWLLPSGSLGAQDIESVSVQVRTGRNWITRVRNAEPEQLQATISNLRPGTRYQYRVVSIGEDGSRDFSAPKRFTTR